MKSIFKGKHVVKVYKFDSYSGYSENKIPYVIKKQNVVSYETILETALDTPPLNEGDQFYLTAEDRIIKIEKTLRGTDNVMVYLTDVVLSTEEELEESLKSAIEEREKYLKERQEHDKNWELRRQKDSYREQYRDAFFIKRLFMTKPE